MNRLRLRVASILGLLLFMGYLTAANFVPEAQRLASPLLPDEGLRLGLDLRGGTHWVLGVELETAEVHELQFLGDSLQRFADEGRAAIAALAEGRPADSRGLSRWWPEKTPYPSDARKLLAAVLLIVRIGEAGAD